MAVVSPFGDIKARIEADDQDVDVLILGDSTSNSLVDDSGGREWPLLFMDYLAARYPTHSVRLYEGQTDSYVLTDGATGTGSNMVTIWNASGGGWKTDFFLSGGAQNHLIADALGTVRLTIISLGHNEADPIASRFTDLYADILADQASSDIAVMTQNAGTSAQQARQPLIAADCHVAGYRTFDVFDAWIAYGDYSALQADVTHPNQVGQVFWNSVLQSIWESGDVNMSKILNRSELRLEAKEHAAVGNWLDGSGNGHNAVKYGATEYAASDYGVGFYVPEYEAGAAPRMFEGNSKIANIDNSDLDIVVRASCNDWYQSGVGQTSVLLYTSGGWNGISLSISSWGGLSLALGNGVDAFETISVGAFTADARFVNGVIPQTFRVRYERDTGAGQYSLKGYIWENDAWSQIGVEATGATVASVAHTAVKIGNSNAGASATEWGGTIYSLDIYTDLDTRLVKRFGFDPSGMPDNIPVSTTTLEDTGGGITLALRTPPYVSAVGKGAAPTNRNAWLRATADYHEIPDHANLNFAVDEDFTIMMWRRFPIKTPAASAALFAKKDTLTTAAGYVVYLSTTGMPVFRIADGTAATAATGPAVTAGSVHVITAVRDATADTLTVYTDGVAGTPVTDTTTATLANALDVRLDRLSGAGASYATSHDFADVLWREALTADEVVLAAAELMSDGLDAWALLGRRPAVHVGALR